jgi:hypothetical protein
MDSKMSHQAILFFLVGLWLFPVSAIGATHSDILLAVDKDNRVSTGGVDLYYEQMIGPTTNTAAGLVYHEYSNPGINRMLSLPPGFTTLPGTRDVSFSLVRFGTMPSPGGANLWFWDGKDDDGNGNWLNDADFLPVTDGTSFAVVGSTSDPFGGSPRPEATVTGTDADVPGFMLGRTSLTGNIHVHPTFHIRRAQPNPPAAGFYATALSFSIPGRESSRPVVLVFSIGATPSAPAVQAMNDWLAAHVLSPAGDTDGDRLPNLVEHGLGSNPLSSDAGIRYWDVALLDAISWNTLLTVRRRISAASVPIRLSFEYSHNLTLWMPVEPSPTVVPGEAAWDELRVVWQPPTPSPTAFFFRLRAENSR